MNAARKDLQYIIGAKPFSPTRFFELTSKKPLESKLNDNISYPDLDDSSRQLRPILQAFSKLSDSVSIAHLNKPETAKHIPKWSSLSLTAAYKFSFKFKSDVYNKIDHDLAPLVAEFHKLRKGFMDIENCPDGDVILHFYQNSEPSVPIETSSIVQDKVISDYDFKVQDFTIKRQKITLLRQDESEKKYYQDVSGFVYQDSELGTFVITSLNAHSGAALILAEYILDLKNPNPQYFILSTDINKLAAEIYKSGTRINIPKEGSVEIELSGEKHLWIPETLKEIGLAEDISHTQFATKMSPRVVFMIDS